MGDFAAKKLRPFSLCDKLGQHGDDRGDGQHTRRQKKELPEPDPLVVFLVSLQQEFHRGPIDLLLPHEVDQMDQQREEDQKEGPGQRLMDEWHGG